MERATVYRKNGFNESTVIIRPKGGLFPGGTVVTRKKN